MLLGVVRVRLSPSIDAVNVAPGSQALIAMRVVVRHRVGVIDRQAGNELGEGAGRGIGESGVDLNIGKGAGRGR